MTSILEEAWSLVNGSRNDSYGEAEQDFSILAEFWTSYLKARGLLNREASLDADDPPNMMMLLKIRRQAHRRKRDNLIDVAGYADCSSLVVERLGLSTTYKALPEDEQEDAGEEDQDSG